jgi:hypothetical protein
MEPKFPAEMGPAPHILTSDSQLVRQIISLEACQIMRKATRGRAPNRLSSQRRIVLHRRLVTDPPVYATTQYPFFISFLS